MTIDLYIHPGIAVVAAAYLIFAIVRGIIDILP